VSDHIKNLLEQQLELLSGQSKKDVTVDDLAMLSRAMVEIAAAIGQYCAQVHQ
jgi:hypothetical protein